MRCPQVEASTQHPPTPNFFLIVASTTLWEAFALRTTAGASGLELGVRAILNTGELAPIIPFVNTDGGAYVYAMDDELPSTDPRLLDEANDDSQGSTVTEAEVLKIYGKDIKTDSSKIALFGRNAHARQIEASARALRMRIERDFVKGDSAASAGREMDGLRKKITVGSSQAIANHSSGAGLSFAALDDLIDAVDGPNSQKRLIMGKKLAVRFAAASRATGVSGTVNFELNEIGRQSMFYGDVEIIRTDVDSRNVAIQGFDEASSTSSVYCVSMGEGLVSGVQGPSLDQAGNPQPGLVVYDVGESFATPTRLTRISWHAAMVIENKRAAARLYNITNAAITA